MRLEGTLPHVLAAPAADPTLASFYQLTWWLVLLKVVVVFVFLLLTTMFMIWAERRVIGRMQDGEPALAGTARPVVARMSAATAAEAGAADGDKVTVATDRGSVTVPVEVVPMADHVVWLPAAGLPGNAAETAPYPGYAEPAVQAGPTIRARLGAGHGAMVTLRRPE